jgi:hypothetical protein
MFALILHKLCKQWKSYNWLNIVNIFLKNDWLFIQKKQKLSVQPNIIKKNAEALLDASKEIGLEVNSEKTKYWVEKKVFAFFKWKVNLFLNIFTIFNQLYNFHCVQNFCNGKTNINGLNKRQYSLCLRHLFENAKKLSVQPNLSLRSNALISRKQMPSPVINSLFDICVEIRMKSGTGY